MNRLIKQIRDKVFINKTIIDVFSVSSATILAAIITFTINIFTRNILGADLIGIWLSVSLIFTFGPLLQLGILDAMTREIPFYSAKEQHGKVQEIRNVTFSYLLLVAGSGTLGICLITLFIYFYSGMNYYYLYGFLLAAIILFILFLVSYIELSLRAIQNFKRVSYLIFIKNTTHALLTLIFTLLFGYYGLYIGLLIAVLLELVLGRDKIKGFAFNFNWPLFKHLIKTGFPILSVGLIWTLMTGIDRIIIIGFLNSTMLGYYGVALLVFNAIMIFPKIIGQVMYPKLNFAFGKNERYNQLSSIYSRVNRVISPLTALITSITFILIVPFVEMALPGYVEGINAAQILALGVYPLSMVGMAGSLFNTLGKQKVYMAILLGATLLNIVLGLVLIIVFMNIEVVAVATSLTYFIYCILMNACIMKILSGKTSFQFMFRLFLPGFVMLTPIVVGDYIWGTNWETIMVFLIWLALCGIFQLPKVIKLNRNLKKRG